MTTSVKIPARIKARVAREAKKAGITVHAYLLQLIEQGAERAEKRREFVEEAVERLKEFRRTGMAIPAKDAAAYFAAVRRGENPPPPKPVKVR